MKAYINGIILDGTLDMVPLKDHVILEKDGLIEDIVLNNSDFSGYEIVDLKGSYIMPGLINLHVHLPASGKPKKKESDPKKLVKLMTSNKMLIEVAYKICANYSKMQLMSGVTTIRTVGGILDIDSRIRDDVESGKLLAPHILASNMAISVKGGHMAGSLAYEANSVEEAKYYVEKINEGKPNLIKLMITGGVLDATKEGEPGVLKMPAEIVKASCDKAHELGLKVAAHVESSEGVKVALLNGVDTIEHGAKCDEEIIDLFKKHHAYHVATLSPALPFALFDRKISNVSEMAQKNGQIVFEGVIDCAKQCLANDILVGLGTDTGCPYVTHYDMWRELNYYHKYCEVTNNFALHTATLVNAKIAGIDAYTGSIEKGKVCDLVVTKENPLDDIKALRNVEKVVLAGKLINNPKVKKMKKVEKELDKFI